MKKDSVTIFDPAKNAFYKVPLERAKQFVVEAEKVALKIKELENAKDK
jgi:hypothetical protein